VRYDKKKYICLQVRYPLFLSNFNETWIFSNYWNVEFHENTPSGSWVVPCRQTDIMNLIVAPGNFVNKLKNTVPQWVIKLNNAPQTWLLNGYKLQVLQFFQIHVWIICCIIVYFLIACVNLYQAPDSCDTLSYRLL
jgi:hypothetical protein